MHSPASVLPAPRRRAAARPAMRPASVWLHVGAWTALIALLVGAYLHIRANGQTGDEIFHVDQIMKFLRGEWEMNPSLTTLPGYHLLVAAVASVLGVDSLAALRVVSLVLSGLTLPVFFALACREERGTALIRTLQYGMIPILFPFFFLIYTDLTGILLILTALLALQSRRFLLSALYAAAAVCVRQNLFAWFLFVLLLGAFTCIPPAALRHKAESARAVMAQWVHALRAFRLGKFLRRFWPYLLGIVLFGVFVSVNDGIALGDSAAHPFPSVHTGNLFFAIFLLWLLFMPLHIANTRRIVLLIRRHPAIAMLLFAGVFLVYWFTFSNTHAYNQEAYTWWLRNRLLVLFTSSVEHRFLFFLAVMHCIYSLCVTPLLQQRYLLLYPFSVAYLLPSWLVEQRYYLLPYTLFLLYRRQHAPWVELLHLLYATGMTAFLFMGIAEGIFFL